MVVIIVVVLTTPKGAFLDVTEPHWEITSENLKEDIRSLLPASDEPIILHPDNINMSLQTDAGFRIMNIALMLIVAGYMILILQIFKNIVKDVRNRIPFNCNNIKRVNRIGLLVTVAPLVEWTLHTIMSLWINSRFQFDSLKLESNLALGWPVLILGLLIIVLGVAFEQGEKIQEESELTI